MFRFAMKHMAVRFGKNALIALSVIITLAVSLLACNISGQVRDGILSAYRYYDTVIGPAGSQTQLVMNTLFFTDQPLGLIPYETLETLRADNRVTAAIPFAAGDSYGGARIVGTEPAFLAQYGLAEGTLFSKPYQAVVGWEAARRNGLRLGGTFYSVHGLDEDVAGHEHSEEGQLYTVVGILGRTHTAADKVVFADIHTVWQTHGLEEHGEEHEDEDHDHEEEHGEEEHEEGHEGEEHEEEGEHSHDAGVTAIILNCVNPAAQMSLAAEYNQIAGMQAVNPAQVMRELQDNVDLASNIVYILCGVILAMNLFIICVITMLNMIDIRADITLLRMIGVSKGRIQSVTAIQGAVIALVSALAGFGVSRLLMPLIGAVTESMGILLNTGLVYGIEFAVTAAVIAMTVLPLALAVRVSLSKEIINDT
ncbi:MAG: hypothetical protein LBR85_01310 [Oscillospiraceae bacterium]|jgi:hypothetical protein|nr:hypothetical protein [Oscillospiraceae bacterium]